MSKEITQFFIPAEGLRVVDPTTGAPLPVEGGEVRGNREYWIRRVNDGDVVQQETGDMPAQE